ncbi:MAG: hypothetical protein JWN83_2043 [Chitinophagaceae bacterium]|nr:hypothetical protein [Chitinophagaceae bacterium]
MNSAKGIKNKKPATSWITELSFGQLPAIKEVSFIKDEIAFVLNDDRIICIPLAWSKKLQSANQQQRQNFRNNGIHVFWDDVDEIIGVKNILFGKQLFI